MTEAHTAYVALLRGVNVGGNRKVEMKRLRAVFEDAGMERVSTYINSGNVLFHTEPEALETLTRRLSDAIEIAFGFAVDVLVIRGEDLLAIARALPPDWANDEAYRCDVLFLWPTVDMPTVVAELPLKPDVGETLYVPGAVLWHVPRSMVTRSGITKLIGTPLYSQMTVRNCNTVRRLAELLSDVTR